MLLVVDCSVEPEMYCPVAHWGRFLAADAVAWRPRDGGPAPDLASCSHVLVTGSEASITSADPWIDAACDVVRAAATAGVPVLGSCFGHQLLVRALAGRAFVRASATPELGWIEVVRTDPRPDPVLDALPWPLACFSSHFDEVAPLPPGWDCLATTPRCDNAVIRLAGRPVWGIQHHPEILPDEGASLLRGLAARLPARRDALLAALAGGVRDSRAAGALVAAFLAVPRLR